VLEAEEAAARRFGRLLLLLACLGRCRVRRNPRVQERILVEGLRVQGLAVRVSFSNPWVLKGLLVEGLGLAILGC
jgi:hypothetical protein